MALFTNQMRINGMSGLDVNTIVMQLMQGHATRLDRMRQNREVLAWQQQAMQGVARDLRAFRDANFLSIGANAKPSIGNEANFNFTRNVVTDSNGQVFNGVSVRMNGNQTGNHKLEVIQTAAGDKFTTTRENSIGNNIIGSEVFSLEKFEPVNDDPYSPVINVLARDGISLSFSLNGLPSQEFKLTGNEVSEILERTAARPAIPAVEADEANGIEGSDAVPAVPADLEGRNRMVLERLNTWLSDTFGSDNIATSDNEDMQRIKASITADGKLAIGVRSGHSVNINGDKNTLEAVGVTADQSSRRTADDISMDEFIGDSGRFDFRINDVRFSFGDGAFRVNSQIRPFPGASENRAPTLQELMTAVNASDAGVNMSYNSTTGEVSLESTSIGATSTITMTENTVSGSNFLRELGFVSGFGLGSATMGSASHATEARDAIIKLDNQHYERSTNTFTIDGLEIDLSGANVKMGDPSIGEPLSLNISVTKDTSGTMDMIKGFVEEYNKLIRSIRDLTNERRPRQSGGGGFFLPLTEDQKREMTEREVEMWEEQAKKGILSRDMTLRSLADNLHSNVFRDVVTPDGRRLNLSHFGIRTNGDLDKFGELIIDEERLTQALEERGEDVKDLFTQRSDIAASGQNANRNGRLAESGIASRINDIMNWETLTGGGIYRQSGVSESQGINSNIGNRIRDADRRMDILVESLQRREERYFQQFSRLEAAMAQSNSQMEFLFQMTMQ